MLALSEYRCPRRQGDSFIAIKAGQANIAQQQVVAPVELTEQENVTNEKGLSNGSNGSPSLSAHLPVVKEGPHVTSREHPAREAMETDKTSRHNAGRGAIEDERLEARRTVSGESGTEATGKDSGRRDS